jgi:hypothetical protein
VEKPRIVMPELWYPASIIPDLDSSFRWNDGTGQYRLCKADA